MAVDKEKLTALCAEINEKNGKGSAYTIDGEGSVLNIKRWSTGIEDLDSIIGGGMPCGRVVEIYGPEGSGKTSLLYHLCAQHETALDIPIEGTMDVKRAKVFGNRKGQMLIYRAMFGEDAFAKAIRFAKAGVPLIGIDSVPSMLPKEDFDKIVKSADKETIEEPRIGGVARLMARQLPVVESVIEITGTTLIFINQVRDKMNAMLFGEKTDTMGGHKLKHACSLRLQVARKAWIEIPNKNPCNSAVNEKVGLIMKVKVVKSKICNPMGECEIPMFFDRGFVGFDDIKDIRKELMKKRNEEFKKAK